MSRADVWMGNLFSRGVQPDSLEAMSFQRHKYWNEKHCAIIDAENLEAERIRATMEK